MFRAKKISNPRDDTDIRPRVQVRVGEHSDYLRPSFVVDTGSVYSSISPRWLEILGYRIDPESGRFVGVEYVTKEVSVMLADGSVQLEVGVRLHDVQIGSLYLSSFVFYVPVNLDNTVSCLLGMDFIDCFRLTLDPNEEYLFGDVVASVVGEMFGRGVAFFNEEDSSGILANKMTSFD